MQLLYVDGREHKNPTSMSSGSCVNSPTNSAIHTSASVGVNICRAGECFFHTTEWHTLYRQSDSVDKPLIHYQWNNLIIHVQYGSHCDSPIALTTFFFCIIASILSLLPPHRFSFSILIFSPFFSSHQLVWLLSPISILISPFLPPAQILVPHPVPRSLHSGYV